MTVSGLSDPSAVICQVGGLVSCGLTTLLVSNPISRMTTAPLLIHNGLEQVSSKSTFSAFSIPKISSRPQNLLV